MMPFVGRDSQNVTSQASDTADLNEKASYVVIENNGAAAETVKFGFRKSPSATLRHDTYTIPAGAVLPLYCEVCRVYATGLGADIVVHAIFA
jgi:hypothetical protein